MQLNDYQAQAKTTNYSDEEIDKSIKGKQFLSTVLGLVGEAGEFADKVKKVLWHNDGEFTADQREDMLKELGDVLWCAAMLSEYLDSDLETVAQMNLDKLASRVKKGNLRGNGDNR